MKLKGICLDNALLAIANYLVRLENYLTERGIKMNFEDQVNWILNNYSLVEEDERDNFITSIKNLYNYRKQNEIKSIDGVQFAKFKFENSTINQLEKDLEKDLERALSLS
ncbi:MAG: hypothetical protein HXM14_01300 [Fusobacterium periodonticum]|mgnify:FL=1|nr:hypothetical protein [Fusobacterium periodonticum]